MKQYRMLDLFSGLSGASQAMREDENWEVITVDIEKKFNPTICADILDLTPDDFEQYGHFDLIWASPPCTYFSVARQPPSWYLSAAIKIIPTQKECSDAVKMVFHTVWLIEQLHPSWWFLENPRGWLRFIIGKPSGTVDYCQYGHEYKKPTDLWGNHPPSFSYRRCNGNCHHIPTPDAFPTVRNPAKRAVVPYGLSKAIKESVENPVGCYQAKIMDEVQ